MSCSTVTPSGWLPTGGAAAAVFVNEPVDAARATVGLGPRVAGGRLTGPVRPSAGVSGIGLGVATLYPPSATTGAHRPRADTVVRVRGAAG